MEVRCKKCGEFFNRDKILVSVEGFFCENCIPVDVQKRFITLHFSWTGLTALVAVIENTANVDQLLLVDGIKEKIEAKMLQLVKEIIEEHGGEIQNSDS